MVGSQAVLNVLLEERYKISPNEIKTYLVGGYGRPPGKLDPEIRRKILGGDQAFVASDVDAIEPEYDKNFAYLQKLLHRKPLEEEVVAYTIFPGPVEEYMRQKELKSEQQKTRPITSDEKSTAEVEFDQEKKIKHNSAMKNYRVTVAGEEYIVELEELSS